MFGILKRMRKKKAIKVANYRGAVSIADIEIECPKCGTMQDATWMKANGTDEDGYYYENYHCEACDARFAVVDDEEGSYIMEDE